MAEVHGSCDERFAGVRDALARQLDGEELGASVAVDLDGETVVDLWGGYRDVERTTPWTRDTIVNVWSTTKCVLNLAALMLVDRGELDVYAPVADYWPEFAAKGKKNIEVRHLMSHTSGVSGWETPFSIRDMYDWEPATERLASQAPWWEPGTASGYHSKNQGHLVGEVIRRITSPTRCPWLFAWYPDAVPGSHHGRCSASRSVEVSQSYMSLIENGWSQPETVELVFAQQSDGVDLVLEAPFRFGIGYCLGTPVVPYVPAGRTFFWDGWGGSLVVMDLDRRLTISYMMNKMAPGVLGSDRSEAYVRAVYSSLA